MRKIFASLLVAAMVLGLASTAFAAFSDTAGNKYIDKVNAYKWMEGYPDGTFKPAGSITRAEAATVIVRALGLEAAADAAKGLGSKFSDVTATHWASGYINVCTSKDIIKGYPDGTFGPEANVTNAEMITMIVRALNREFEAIGEWPIGHITAAAGLGIVGTGFASNEPATRENVATYVAKASNKAIYRLTPNGWEEDKVGGVAKTLASLNQFKKYASVKLATVNDSTTKITVSGNPSGEPGSYDLASNYIVAGGKLLKDLLGANIIVTVDTDNDNKAVLIEVDTDVTTVSGDFDYAGTGYFYLKKDTTRYELADGANIYLNGAKSNLADLGKSTLTAYVDSDDKVTEIRAEIFNKENTKIGSVSATGDASSWTISTSDGTWGVLKGATITRNGVVVSLSDIKKDDIADIAIDEIASKVYYLRATNKTVSGKITGYREAEDSDGKVRYLSIDGVEYRMAKKDSSDWKDARVGADVKATLAPNGRVYSMDITGGLATYVKVKQFITDSSSYTKWVVDVRGTETTYEIAKDYSGSTSIKAGDYVQLKFDNSTRIKEATPVGYEDLKDGTAAYQRTAKVYASDKLVKIEEVKDDEAARVLVGEASFVTLPDTAVVYINGVYTTISGVPEDAYIKYVLDGDSAKIVFMNIDTDTKYVSGKVETTNNSIESYNGAVAAGAKVYLYESSDDMHKGEDLVDVKTGDTDGKFPAFTGLAADKTYYLKIVESYGNYTTTSVTTKKSGD